VEQDGTGWNYQVDNIMDVEDAIPVAKRANDLITNVYNVPSSIILVSVYTCPSLVSCVSIYSKGRYVIVVVCYCRSSQRV